MKEIKLTGKLGAGKTVMVDDEDYERLNKYRWWGWGKPERIYPVTQINRKFTLMHRFVLDITNHLAIIDHADNNSLNCQKNNLRICNRGENNRNAKARKNKKDTKYKGIYTQTNGNSWMSMIRLNRKDIHLGTYSTEIEAAIIYNEAALKYHGEFALLNHIPEEESKGIVPIRINKEVTKMKLGVRKDSSSGYKGIYWDKGKGKWRARIGFRGKVYILGTFAGKDEAARAYNEKAKELYGNEIWLNPVD